MGISRLRLTGSCQRCSAGGQARGCPPAGAWQASLSETARCRVYGGAACRGDCARCLCRGPSPGAADRCRPTLKGWGSAVAEPPQPPLCRPRRERAWLTLRAGCDRTAKGPVPSNPATANAEARRRGVARRARPSAKPGSPPPGRGSPPRLPPQAPNPRSPRAAAATSLCLDSRCRAAGPRPAEQQRDTLP
jgi:hypothetical protein